MKLLKWTALLFIVVLAVPCRVSAASFIDDMVVLQNTAETQYSGLKYYTGATYGLFDQTLLTVSNPASPQGHALYRVNAAESVTAGIYTTYGTCVLLQETQAMLGLGAKQALWSKSKDAVYSDFGGGIWRVELDLENRYDPVFAAASAMPSDAVGFGVNLYALPGTGKPLTVTVTKSMSEVLCYEEYTAMLPAGTQYVKVEINDVTAYPLKGGGTLPNRMNTALASVKISGEALVMGEPAKVTQQQTVPSAAPADEEEEAEAYSAAYAASDKPAQEMPEDGYEPEASSSKAASSKFEGTITSSSKSEKSQAAQVVVPDEASASSSKRAESAPSRDNDPREAVYEIRRDGDGGGMRSGVTAYIIVVALVLVGLLIFGRRK